MGGEIGDGGESVITDAAGAPPVPGGGRVGVVGRDDGVAALAAAEDVDAAGQAVLGGVEVFVADDGFDVIEDGDRHDQAFRLAVKCQVQVSGWRSGMTLPQ